tara:strand:+ start:320 stop:556 length:237 start_codon:yes stop_codon:yes gene_type:complete
MEIPMSKEAEDALENAVKEMRQADSQYDDKIEFWNGLMNKYNTTGLAPIELMETPEGQQKLDKINKLISQGMVKKFGE